MAITPFPTRNYHKLNLLIKATCEGDIFRLFSFQILIDCYLSFLQFAYYSLGTAYNTSKSMQDLL
jgi:hypothetical protein